MPIVFEALDLVLLAAGRSARFGGVKLATPVAGRPLAQHAGAMFARLPFARHIAVVADDDFGLADIGFRLVRVEGDPALSRSIATGIAALARSPGEAVMLALADMPLVPRSHVAALCESFAGDRVATASGGVLCPPAIFARHWHAALLRLEGDRGAGSLLQNAVQVPLPDDLACDIDTPADMADLSRRLGDTADS